MLGVRASMLARLTSVTYARSVIIRLNNAKARPIAGDHHVRDISCGFQHDTTLLSFF